MENGASAEVAVVGNEGIAGNSLLMGGESTPSRAVVQSGGTGLRLSARMAKQEFELAGLVVHLLLRYTQALSRRWRRRRCATATTRWTSSCVAGCCSVLDRLQGSELVMTQELIANMLGVRREGVTEGAVRLQQLGMIRYSRGHITVLDRPGLERRTCECYAVVKKEYDHLLGDKVAT
jgi:hypothetical protein